MAPFIMLLEKQKLSEKKRHNTFIPPSTLPGVTSINKQQLAMNPFVSPARASSPQLESTHQRALATTTTVSDNKIGRCQPVP